jgi:hypothetical protein
MKSSHLIAIAALVLLSAACGRPPADRPVPAAPAGAPGHWPAALAGVANMGFADDRPGDGAGGWSDQGWSNSFAEFEIGRSSFGGVPFTIVDPAANHGRAVVSFRHETLPGGPTSVVASFPSGARGRWLYLLHTACWVHRTPGGHPLLGTAVVRDRDHAERRIGIRLGHDLADWWNPVRVANGAVVAAKPNQSALVGVYLSRFDLGAEVEAVELRLSTTAAALWIVAGATLSARDIPLPELQPLTIASGAAWKHLPTDDLVVKAGTALDRSAWVGQDPAGSRGRVIARPDGQFSFASAPSIPVRFFCCTGPDWVFDRPEGPDPEAFAEAVRRQGYNMVRYHYLDFRLAGQPKWGRKIDAAGIAAFDARAADGQALDPAGLDLLDRLNAALKRRGIYLFLDAMSSVTGYYPANPWTRDHGAPDLKALMYGDPAARAHYRQAVTQLLTHRNPYTGLSLAEDPMVAVILGCNELENNIWAYSGWKTALLQPWRAFLARRYPDPAAWQAAWGRGPEAKSFAEAPIFAVADTWKEGRCRTDVATFLAEVELETAGYQEGVLRAAGYPGIFTCFDYLKNLRYYLMRARFGAVSMHAYYAGASDGVHPGSKILQASAVGDALNWWRVNGATRIAGRPHLTTEYGHLYWNRYRYEEGLSVGAYAALQGTSGLFGYSQPMMLSRQAIKPYAIASDPIARASQVVTGLAWRGAAVAPAKHLVYAALSRAEALAQSQEAISGEQNRLALLTGFAVQVEGGPDSAPSADLVLPLVGGARVIDTATVSGALDQPATVGFAAAVAELRRHGILPAGNRTDPGHGVYESDTGEILLEARERRLTVATPTLAGVCADQVGSPLAAGALTLAAASAPVAATAAALDGRPLTAAARLLLVLATDARNDGEAYADAEAMILAKRGGDRVLVRTGTFALALRRDPGAPALRAWALALDGTRCDAVPLATSPDGLHLAVDTAAWSCGPTQYIELAER